MRGGETTIGEASRQTTSGETKDEMTGEEEDSRDLASFGWRREGEKCFGLVRTFIPDNFCDLLILLRYPDILTHT